MKQGNAKADWWLQARSRLNRQFDIEKDRKLTFTDNKFAFQSKTTAELLRASLCFNLFSIKYLVENNEKIMATMTKILGERAFHALMKATVYGQFVAGEDKDKIKGCVERLTGAGVGSILDYAVEEDLDENEAVELEMDACLSTEEHMAEIGEIPENTEMKATEDKKFRTSSQFNDYEMYRAHKEFADRRVGVTSARTYFYKDEEKCDKYMEHFLYCINAAGGASEDGFAAIKLTALGRPQFLLQFSDALVSSRQLFEELAGATKDVNAQKSVLELGFDESRFIDKAGRMGLARSRGDLLETFTFMQEEADSEWIDLLDWNNLIDRNKSFSDIFVIDNHGETVKLMKDLTSDEEDQMKRMLERINTLASEAKRQGVRLMIDAEQTYFQPAISRISVECMREFNGDNPVIFNTYQCYLKQAFKNFVIDLEQARREGFHFGAKIVRGAYMEQERARAEKLGYEDPIHVDYEATSRCYHRTMDVGLEYIHSHGDANIMIASHNIDSIKYAISRMESLDISRSEGKVFFGQLLGMCDQLTFPLGQAGYPAYKYVPFGPVADVLPYLSRRAKENSAIMEGAKAEKQIIHRELFRRLRTFQL